MEAVKAVILAWLKTQWVEILETLLKFAKGDFELAEAFYKAAAAKVRLGMLRWQENFSTTELAMGKLDLRVKAERGFSVSIADPNIYVQELNVSRDIVDAVLMKRDSDKRMRPTTSKWKSRW